MSSYSSSGRVVSAIGCVARRDVDFAVRHSRRRADHSRILRGTVHDAAGQPVAGAALTVVREETGERRQAETGSSGEFTVAHLASGAHRLEIVAPGHAPYIRRLAVDVAQAIWIEARLGVTVDGAVDGLRTAASGIGTAETWHGGRRSPGVRPSARRPQLPRTGAARARGRAVRPWIGDLDTRRLRLQRERRARGQQRVPARRRVQRRSEAERGWRAGAGRCHPGIRGGHQLLRCILRTQWRRHRST